MSPARSSGWRVPAAPSGQAATRRGAALGPPGEGRAFGVSYDPILWRFRPPRRLVGRLRPASSRRHPKHTPTASERLTNGDQEWRIVPTTSLKRSIAPRLCDRSSSILALSALGQATPVFAPSG